MVAHAPHAVLPAHPALIGGIDDERVVIEAEPLERRHYFADAVIDAADLAGVRSIAFCVL